MKDRKKIQKHFKNKYYSKSTNYKIIVSEIRKEESMHRNKLLRAIVTTMITLLGTTSMVFAGTRIYNEYIKKQEDIDSNAFISESNSTYTYDFITENMKYDEDTNLNYKIITDIEDYSIFKEKESKLPDMSENDFKDSFMVIFFKSGLSDPHKSDLTISEVTSDEKTTYITVESNEKPDINKISEIFYIVVDKTLLKENINIKLKEPHINNSNFVRLEDLPKEYSIEDALEDGCFVVEECKVLSKNKYAMDELIEKANNNEESSIRIYDRFNNFVYITDLSYKDGLFIRNTMSSQDNFQEIYTSSGKYLSKVKSGYNSDYYDYDIKNYDIQNYLGKIIVTVDLN